MPIRLIDADLHSHSCVSDGTLAPSAVVRRAVEHGVRLFALTDHDQLGGVAEARVEARRLGVGFIAGVEVSVSWHDETVHILGLHVDPANRALVDGLAATREGREERARGIARALADAGIPGAWEGALRHTRNPAMLSRTHFARFLVERGVCKDTREVFRRFLVEGKPGHVPHRWATLGDAVGWIVGAGGVAVIAHPARYRFDARAMETFVDEFTAAGGRGIEVVCSSHGRDEQRRFAQLARSRHLLASRGTDFHDPEDARVQFGRLASLPEDLVPVWQDWPEAMALVAGDGTQAGTGAGAVREEGADASAYSGSAR